MTAFATLLQRFLLTKRFFPQQLSLVEIGLSKEFAAAPQSKLYQAINTKNVFSRHIEDSLLFSKGRD